MKKVIMILSGTMGILLITIGLISKNINNTSISIIGSADGPTTIFLAGKLGDNLSFLGVILGILFILIAIVLFFQSRNKQ